MVQKMKSTAFISLATILLTSASNAIAGQFLDENGHLQGIIQENGPNGYMILDENGCAEAYIQENGSNGYMILDQEGKAKGYYQED
jgi:hypothetical protein